MPDNFVSGWTVDRGRSFELDKTDTGTATVTYNDTDGILDPTNVGGPHFGDLNPLKPAALALQNPVTLAHKTIFTGYVEDYDFDVHPSQNVMFTTTRLVDAFDILANVEMKPGVSGTTFVDGDIVYDEMTVEDRLITLAADGAWPAAKTNFFSGNVQCKRTVYSPGTSILAAMQDAADAEWPGVGNLFVSKTGIVTFHGRLARFNPTEPTYGINAWKCGDGAAVAASVSDTAQIRGFAWNRGKDRIINSATALPSGIADADIAGQTVTDPTSIATYGIRSWSAENLLTDGGLTDGLDDLEETKLFANYYVNNYKNPQNRISSVTFRSLPPGDARAPALWNLICNVEISDTLEVTVDHPGGGGFTGADYFVEGIHYDVKPANPAYHDVTLTLDLSPAAYYTSNPF